MMAVDPNLPGAEIVERALKDLARHAEFSASLALQVIAPRLRLVGCDVPRMQLDEAAETKLYARLSEESVLDPYSLYNAILRRLRSFAATVEVQYYRDQRRDACH